MNTKQSIVIWNPYPETEPPSLPSGQYKKYLVSYDDRVCEMSWLFNAWHLRHDGLSNISKRVTYWAEIPTPYE